MQETINIANMNKAAVLAALYNNAHPQGLGVLHYTTEDMTIDEASELLSQGQYFDYVKGHVMKVDLQGDKLCTALYNRDNGAGAARRALVDAGLM